MAAGVWEARGKIRCNLLHYMAYQWRERVTCDLAFGNFEMRAYASLARSLTSERCFICAVRPSAAFIDPCVGH